ncbi:type I restriction endonuclease subunit S [Elizabethkingia anophelis]|nr:type I restriction endonuclease subunit S [Elizabethkingia anophelis]MDV3564708.1 type I restriction endonuclease subunit S [Elizabethkingia anophelis]MDV3626484.1 type I restriction endonuclease subunit S [Elizabethkingia anophelis]MDV3644053.1 type I restriction endonuclease subunit S [Elizabethkingia anophelis]MDV3656989.1 type I restriction endonuclease subunit S [Elizabethkingia anophelis]
MSKLFHHKFSDLYEMNSGISSKPEQAGHGAPFVSFKTVFNNFFLPKELSDLMDTSETEQSIFSVKEGDIFLTRTSETLDELGMSSVAYKDYPQATYSGFLKRLRPINPKEAYPKYMAFYLRSKLFRKTMNNNAIMTLRASLNEQIFSYLDLLLPSYEEQKNIGDLLFSIYEKIELNNGINTELEQMAKTLYDYWFVQFDFPNEDGKPYKSSGGKMIYNDILKREIPNGWSVKKLGKYTDIKKGTLITEKTANTEGNIKVVSAGLNFSYYHSEPNFKENTITVSASGANAGYVNFWREPIFACDCTTLRGKNTTETLFVLEFLKLMQDHIYKQAKGSAQPHVYPKDIEILNIIIPSEDILDKYGFVIEPINQKITNNLQQNQELSSLRDWLLPMLMNGQVKVAD